MKWVIRGVSLCLIVICVFWGFYLVNHYNGGFEDGGIAMVRLLYEYDSIQDVYDRQDAIRSRCSDEVWSELSAENKSHWDGTWERSKNLPTKVRVVLSRPGYVVYALENEFVYPSYLWCFEYTIERGIFTSVREYKLVGMRESKDGGFF